MLERRDDDLGLFRSAIRGIMIMAVITALIFAIICVYNKVVYGCDVELEDKTLFTEIEPWFSFLKSATGSVVIKESEYYNIWPPIYRKNWWDMNRGYIPVRPINERKSHGNERAGKNESGR